MKTFTMELYFDSLMDATAAGYPDAKPIDEDLPEVGYFALLSFECQFFELVDADEMDLEVDLSLITKDEDQMELLA